MRVGVDLVEIARVRRTMERHGAFTTRTFTAAEMALAASMRERRRDEFFAGRFAAKEAVLKGLGVGLSGGISMLDIEVGSEPSGAPVLRLTGAARAAAGELGSTEFQVSISHDAGVAVACVVLS